MVELTIIQANLKAPKNQTNHFGKYKYRSCEDILEGLKPHLLEHECYVTLTDDVLEIAGKLMIKATATITNTDGKNVTVSAFAGIDPNKKGMDIAQTFGSSSSYARKYALNGLFAIDDTKDADTQNNTATPIKSTNKPQTSAKPNQAPATKITLTIGCDSYNKAFQSYRDAQSNDERNKVKIRVRKFYTNAEEILTGFETKYKEYLEAKN